MNNGTTYTDYLACPDSVGGTEVKSAWNGQLFAKQVMPFVDMTMKGFTWCTSRSVFKLRIYRYYSSILLCFIIQVSDSV